MDQGNDKSECDDCKSLVPLTTWVLISNYKLQYSLLRRPDGTFNRQLAEFLDRKGPANANPVDGVYSFDVVIDQRIDLWSRVFRQAEEGDAALVNIVKPVTADVVPVIIFFHGGSFTHSSASTAIYDTMCRRLVNICGGVVVSVNYRLAPENRYPCAYDDGWAALDWVNSREWLQSKKDSKVHIFLCGDSSGGNIIHHVAVKAAESNMEVMGNILLNPLFGGEKRTDSELRFNKKYFVELEDRDWYWRAFLPEGADRDHPACNPFGPNGVNLEGVKFPKSLVIVAGLDLVRDWTIAYANALMSFGHEVNLIILEKATVGFYLLPDNDHFHFAMREINNFVNSHS